MSDTHIVKLLEKWQSDSARAQKLVEYPVTITEACETKIDALAEIFGLPKDQLVADLVETALGEIEASMPYQPGSKVIRMEEGDPVYEDVGMTPKYLEARAKIKAMRRR